VKIFSIYPEETLVISSSTVSLAASVLRALLIALLSMLAFSNTYPYLASCEEISALILWNLDS